MIRRTVKHALVAGLRRVFETDEGRALLTSSLDGLLAKAACVPPARWAPYPDLPHAVADQGVYPNGHPIFITARYRTGSTLLWNLFRHIPGITAYYEPFNERRWFERGARERPVDATHRHVDEYWREYAGLPQLKQYYRDHWVIRRLWMDSSAWDPAMKRFLDELIERAPGRAVLQFNHIDFRLAWIRTHYPRAKLVHLYRHPRDQWCSSLLDPSRFPKDGTVAEFRTHDHFYLLQWSSDLKYQFPFLDEAAVQHPYELFYFIWKLSYLYGVEYADYSLSFESLTEDPRRALERLLSCVGVDGGDLDALCALVDPPAPKRWRCYADDEWFRAHESRCEAILADFASDSRLVRFGEG